MRHWRTTGLRVPFYPASLSLFLSFTGAMHVISPVAFSPPSDSPLRPMSKFGISELEQHIMCLGPSCFLENIYEV